MNKYRCMELQKNINLSFKSFLLGLEDDGTINKKMITGHSQMLKSPLRSHPVSCSFDNYALPSPTPENHEKIID